MKIEIGPYVDDPDKKRLVNIQIDEYDTWSMYHTLALIILPMLKQLRKTKQGAPWVDDEDVPKKFQRNSAPPVKEFETDSNFFKRWDFVLGEMIWTFEEISRDSVDKRTNDRIQEGLRLFGKYYQGLWD